jgi:GNAT superfamily N-acetyltransferase
MDAPPPHAEFTVRRADSRDAAALGTMRAAQQREIVEGLSPLADDVYASACAAFFARELDAPDPWVVAWVAVAGGRIAGSVVLTLAPTLPRRGVPQSGPDGRIRSVYVYPELRSRGVARALVVAAIADADARDVARLMLGASAMGRPLYESLGFVAKPDEMMYDP